MSFARNPQYKDSGVEWLDCVKINANKTRQGSTCKRILKLAGYLLFGGLPCKSRSNSKSASTKPCVFPCASKACAPVPRSKFRPAPKH